MSNQTIVLEALMARENVNTTVNTLVQVTGLSNSQTANAAYHLVVRGDVGVSRVMTGVYRYSGQDVKNTGGAEVPPEVPVEIGTPITLRIVGTLWDGGNVALDEAGKAYRLEKM